MARTCWRPAWLVGSVLVCAGLAWEMRMASTCLTESLGVSAALVVTVAASSEDAADVTQGSDLSADIAESTTYHSSLEGCDE